MLNLEIFNHRIHQPILKLSSEFYEQKAITNKQTRLVSSVLVRQISQNSDSQFWNWLLDMVSKNKKNLHCAQSQLFTAGRSEKVKTILHDISSGDLLFRKKVLK